jgi:hypothetical protein
MEMFLLGMLCGAVLWAVIVFASECIEKEASRGFNKWATSHKGMEDISKKETDRPLTADGFDNCFVGYFQRAGGMHIALYNYEKCIHTLIEEGLSWEESIEHMEFNVTGFWVGEGTPAFLHKVSLKDFQELADGFYGE